MMVLHIVPGCFALIDAGTVGKEVLRDGLLHLNVAHILLIPQDDQDRAGTPLLPIDRELFHLVQLLSDLIRRLAFHETVKNVADDLCLLRHDDPLLIFPKLISQHPFQIDMRDTRLELLLDAPSDVIGNGTALILCQCRKNRKDQLTFGIQCVDVLFLEIDTHGRLQLPKLTGTGQGVNSVSCKSGNGLCNDVVQLSIHRIFYHAVEFFSMFPVRTRFCFIRVDAGKDPAGLPGDEVFVECFLCRVGSLLAFISRGNTAVSRHTDVGLAFQLPAVLYRAHTGGDHIHFLSCHNLLLSSSLATGLILHTSSAGCRRASYARHNSLRYCGNLRYWNPSLPRSWCHRTSGP